MNQKPLEKHFLNKLLKKMNLKKNQFSQSDKIKSKMTKDMQKNLTLITTQKKVNQELEK